MEKKEFFKEPGFKAITEGKTRVIKSWRLVTIINKLQDSQYYEINHNIIPLTSQRDIPYLGRDTPKKDLGQRFLKEGPLIELNHNRMTLEEAISSRKRHLDLRRKLFDNLNHTEFEIAGYGFWGIRDRRHRRINLVSCIKGAREFAYFTYFQPKGKESELIKLLEYDLEHNYKNLGADIIMEVPSETMTQSPYPITLRSVPIKDNKTKYGVSYDIDADHVCKFRSTRISKRLTTRESFLDFHIVVAYLAVIDYELKENKNQVPLEMCPFVIPNKNLVNFCRKIVNNVVVHYEDKETGEEIKRATNQAEREILLWHKVQEDGHDATCYSNSKLKNYRWK